MFLVCCWKLWGNRVVTRLTVQGAEGCWYWVELTPGSITEVVCVCVRARTPACSTHFPYACMNVWLREELRMFLSWQWVYFKLGFLKILLKYRNVNTAAWCCPSCVLSHTHAQAFGIVGLLEVDRPLGLRTFWLHASLLLVHAPLAYMYICLYVRCMCYVHVYFRYKQSLIS